MKVQFDRLIFEVTRRCNMSCKHCLRGDPQNIDITDEIIDKALENVSYISSITFTGGEPSLNVGAIRHILDVCRKNEILVGSFFIATNGKEVSVEFLTAILEWYNYICETNEEFDLCSVALSRDQFHEEIPEKNKNLLKSFSFYSDEKTIIFNGRRQLLNLGRAKNLVDLKRREVNYTRGVYAMEIFDDCYCIHDTDITITTTGDVLTDCDYAYADTDSIKIGTVFDPSWVEQQYQRLHKSA